MPAKKPTSSTGTVIDEVARGGSEIAGKLTLQSTVVETIAGMAARQVEGVHAFGASRLIPLGKKNPRRGVLAEVGKKEAALDIEIIVEYGCNLREVAAELRQKVADAVDLMAGRKVVEVNVSVGGIHLPEPEAPPPEMPRPAPRPRVQ